MQKISFVGFDFNTGLVFETWNQSDVKKLLVSTFFHLSSVHRINQHFKLVGQRFIMYEDLVEKATSLKTFTLTATADLMSTRYGP